MTNLRAVVLDVLERHDAYCMDDAVEREQLADHLVGALGDMHSSARTCRSTAGTRPLETTTTTPPHGRHNRRGREPLKKEERQMRIKLLRLGHSARRLDLEDGATVRTAIEEAGIEVAGHSISVNGLGAGTDTSLADQDVLVISPKVQGG